MTAAAQLAQMGGNNSTFRNRIINGDMRIDQRNAGASVTPAGDSYTLDRWFISGYGTGLNSSSIQRLSSGVVSGFKNYIRMQAGSTSGTNLFLSQSIETNNCYDLAGESITVSFWYRVNTNFTNPCRVLLGSSTSADTKIANAAGTTSSIGTLTNTSTWTKFTGTVTVPSDALTVGVLITNGYNNVINGANIDITGVQLEKGTVATPFEFRPYGAELALCQRYFEKSYNMSVALGGNSNDGKFATSNSGSTTAYGTSIVFKVSKRTIPTMSGWTYTGTSGSWHCGVYGVNEAVRSVGFDAIGETACQPVLFSNPAGQNAMYGHWAASAEL